MARQSTRVDFKWQDTPRFDDGFDYYGQVRGVNLRAGYMEFGEVSLNNQTINVVHLTMKTLKQLHLLSTGNMLTQDTKNWLIRTGQVESELNDDPSWRVNNGSIREYVREHINELENIYATTGRRLLVRSVPKKGGLLNVDTTEHEAYLIASEHYSILPSEDVKAHFDTALATYGLRRVREESYFGKSIALIYEYEDSQDYVLDAGNGRTEQFKKHLAVVAGRNDGTLSVKMYFGLTALSCLNQLWFAKSTESDRAVWVRIFHYEKKSAPLSRLSTVIERASTKFDGVFDTIKSAMSHDLTRFTQKRLINELKNNGRLTEQVTEQVLSRLESEPQSLWGVTQAMTWVATHDREINKNVLQDVRSYAGRILQHWVTVKDNLETWQYTDFIESAGVIDEGQARLITQEASV